MTVKGFKPSPVTAQPLVDALMITVDRLTKKYGDFTAVDDVTFTAEPGPGDRLPRPQRRRQVHHHADHGRPHPAHLRDRHDLGRRFADLPNPGREVGVLLDASAQHAGRTGREILTLAQRTMGLPGRRVEEMLDLVSLTADEADRRVRDYSLGMRQRLGIATALIGDPEVLILDEPANGLDPAGIRWMRDLLRGYADRGGTVLLSSHLLHEIEVIADDLVVIGHGRIVAQGTKSDLLAPAGTIVRARRRDPSWPQPSPAAGITVTDDRPPGGPDPLTLRFMLGVLIRASTGAIVTYFVYAFIAPTLLNFLAFNQDWFRDVQPWVDPNHSRNALFQGGLAASNGHNWEPRPLSRSWFRSPWAS